MIRKKLIAANFSRDQQKEYTLEMAQKRKLKWGSVCAKIFNHKTLFGINEVSHYSKNSKPIYEEYKDYLITELEKTV